MATSLKQIVGGLFGVACGCRPKLSLGLCEREFEHDADYELLSLVMGLV